MRIANQPALAVLHSPLHRLLSGSLLTLWYQGRRSGKDYVLPLQYMEDDHTLVVLAGNAAAKTWWRNFTTPNVVAVKLRGHLRSGKAEVVYDLETKADYLEKYLKRFPNTGPDSRPRFFGKRWSPNRDELRRVAESTVLIAIHVDA